MVVMQVLIWLTWLVVGAVVGWVANKVMESRHTGTTNMLIGILGAFFGGLVFDQLGFVPTITDFNPWSILAALAGAIALMVLFRIAERRTVRRIDAEGKVITREKRQPEVTPDEVYDKEIEIGNMRINMALPILLLLLMPVLDLLSLRMKYPDVTVSPPPFGEVRTYQGEAGKLDYVVYRPDGVGDDAVLPLLVFLHGCASDPKMLEAAAGMTAMADEHAFMIVYPQQNFAKSPHRCWNWYAKENQQRGSGEPATIMGMVEEVQQEYSVDENRTYVAGFSSGAAMTSILASCYRDVFAAAAAHSGMAYESATTPIEALIAPVMGNQVPTDQAGRDAYECSEREDRPIPMLIVHGTVDTIVFPVNGDHKLEQYAQMNDLADDGEDNQSIPEMEMDSATLHVDGGHSYTREESRTDDGLLLERYIVEGLWHMWSGGTGTPPLSDPLGPDATRIVWEFVSAYSLEDDSSQEADE